MFPDVNGWNCGESESLSLNIMFEHVKIIQQLARNNFINGSSIVDDKSPLPLPCDSQEADEKALELEPWVHGPIHIDYGTNVKLGHGVFINFNCTILDTCEVTVGARTLIGPNVSLYSGTHPEDPILRNGTNGPELGKPIVIEEDVWIGGNVIILPGVTIGKGAVIGAGSVVTKNVPNFWIAAGNPAKAIRRVVTTMDPFNRTTQGPGVE
jgi:acetyltransferase-like isoleucine patch superfamily enzyme